MTSQIYSFLCLLGAIIAMLCRIDGAAALTLDDKTLEDMIVYLRGDDYGLVRPGPSDITYERQLEIDGPCNHDKLNEVLNILVDDAQDLPRRGKAVEVVVLCTANQPLHRAFIGRYQEGLALTKIFELMKGAAHVHQSDNTMDQVEVAALAGEAIWILSFASVANHAAFVKADAITVLADVMSNCDITSLCSHAQMWAAGALQNLMASYCDTETGHCMWEWHGDNEGHAHATLEVHEDISTTVDGEAARLLVLEHNDHELVHELVERVCRGPSDARQGDAMPGDATIKNGAHLQADSIVTWTAAGAIKNLALSPKARDYLVQQVDRERGILLSLCLCELATSEDWLEQLKADEALFNLGVHDTCHPEAPPMDSYGGPCVDQLGWLSDDKELSCWDYEPQEFDSADHEDHDEDEIEERRESHNPEYYCDKYGHVEGAAHGEESSAVTARRACCFCGGGSRFSNKDHDHEHDHNKHKDDHEEEDDHHDEEEDHHGGEEDHPDDEEDHHDGSGDEEDHNDGSGDDEDQHDGSGDEEDHHSSDDEGGDEL